MKTPRITDFDPDAKVPALKSPLDGMPAIGKPPQKTTPTPLSEKQAGQEEQETGKKPANLQTRKPAKPSPTQVVLEKPEKYTTRLEPSLVKKIKLAAVEKDMKDYELVRTALLQYLEKNT